MKRKLILILFAVLAIAALTVVSANVTKVSAATYSGSCGNNVNYNLDTSTGTLTISGNGSMHNYSCKYYSGITIQLTTAPWGQYFSSIKTVTINNGVTSIGEYAFYNCIELKSITIPDSVTSIGRSAFSGCKGLSSITIPDSVTSIGDGAFSGCEGLTRITIGNSVTSIGSDAFYNCTGLTSITIPDSVTSIGDKAFYNCTGLTSITIPDSVTSIGRDAFNYTKWYNTQPNGLVYAGKVAYEYKYAGTGPSNVVIIDGTLGIADSAFYGCTGLTSITIPDSVTSIGSSAFRDCTGLTSITIPDSVTSIGDNAFYRCTGLTSITIPDSVTSVGSSAFYNTKWYNNQPDGLVYAGKVAYSYKGTFPSNVTIKDGTLGIADYAFSYFTRLTSITFPDSVTSIGNYAFRGCTGLTSITIPDSVTSIGNNAFYNCMGLTNVTIGNSVTSIGNQAFYGCTNFTSISVPNSVTSIGNQAFYGCTNLTSISVPNSATSIGDSAFSGCRGIKEMTVPGTINMYDAFGYSNPTWVKKVTIVGDTIGDSAFSGCTGLTSITIPDSVTSIGAFTFYNCTGLTSITIPDSVTSIGNNAFYNCMGLTNVTIGNSVTSIGNQAFYGCTNFTSISVPNSVTSIGDSAFSNCSKLTNITIPDSVTSIGDGAFQNCKELTSITIPNSVTTVGCNLFSGCTLLESVVIGDSVTSIDSSLFSGCTGLTSVLIGDSVSEIGSSAFSGFTGWANTKNNAYAQSYFKSKNIKYTVSYGEENYWGYDPAAKTLYVFGTGRTENYKNVTSTPWTSLATDVKKIVIEDGIEYIGNFSFRNFTSLDYLEKSDGVEFGYNALPDGFKAVNSAVPLSPEISWVTENTVELKAVDGYEYRRGSGTWQTSNLFTGLWEGYSYSFSQRIAETDKYRPSAESASVSVTTVTSPSSVSMTSFTEEALTLSPVGRGEYSLDLVHWQTSNVITDFPKNETFRVWVRIAGTSARKASAPASPVTFVYLTGPEFVEYIDETLRIKEYPGVRCEYSNDNVNWQSESVFTGIPQGVDLDIYIRPVESSVIYAGGVREFHGEHGDVYETEAILDEALYKVKKCSDCGVILEKTFIKSVFVYGDATGDGVVTAADIVRLKKYVASGNTLAVGKGEDANGDGVVDSLDVVRLKNYFASYDYDKKTSPIKLGAQN